MTLRNNDEGAFGPDTQAEIAGLRTRLAELETSFGEFQADAERQLAAAEKRNAELSEAVWLREQHVLAFMVSRSWQVTKPMRAVSRLLMPIRRRLEIRRRFGELHADVRGRDYRAYLEAESKRLAGQREEIRDHIGVMICKPSFCVVIDARRGTGGLAETIKSAREQHYAAMPTLIVVSGGPVGETVKDVGIKVQARLSPFELEGDFLVFLECGQILAPNALYEFASLLNQHDDIDLIYADQDAEDASGDRGTPFFKPGWSPDYLETFNYIGFPACYRRCRTPRDLAFSGVYDFVLRYTEQTQSVRHIAKSLGHKLHRSAGADTGQVDIEALEGRLARTGRRGTVRAHPQHPGCHDIEIALDADQLVSIIVPTAGKTVDTEGRKIDLVVNLVDQIRARSTYRNIEIIVVDNGDLSSAQIDALARHGCRLVTYREPTFNVSKKLNLGASEARGELFVLINDDIEIVTPGWIERMLEHFKKPHVGVVGAKLLYPDGTLQHAGVVHNRGKPEHVRRFFPGDDAGYFFSTCGVRNYSAVTGACMMTTAQAYRDVGGYNERLAISYNDLDYCLKLARRGLSVVYAPAAELIHMEAQSRDPKLDWTENMLFLREWGAQIMPDEFYNERQLSVEPPTFLPNVNPRLI